MSVIGGSIDDAIKAGLEHHYAGRLAEAEAIYRRVHATAPDHPDALHLLGMIAYQTGQLRAAAELIGRAIAVEGSRAEFHHDLGDVLQAQAKPDEAIAAYRRAIALNALIPETHFALGNALAGSRRPEEATISYRAALALRADYADASNNLAVVLQQQGRQDEAVAVYREALALTPDSADLHYNLGNTQRTMGLLDDAEASYRRAVALAPNAAVAHFNLAAVLQAKRAWDDAAQHYRAAIAAHPGYAEAYYGLGLTLQARGRAAEAVEAFMTALAHAPGHLAARMGLAYALAEDGRLNDAAAAFRALLTVSADSAQAHGGLGNVLLALGRAEEAEQCQRRAIALAPADARAHNDLGGALRAQGRHYAALTSYRRALDLDASSTFKAMLADCLRDCRFTAADADIRALAARAVSEAWLRPADLANTVGELIMQAPGIGECVARANAAWPARLDAGALFGADGLGALCRDELLHALLLATPVCSPALERCLTMTRAALLAMAETSPSDAPQVIAFHAALAGQCFINEYVFALEGDEAARAASLRDRVTATLQRGEPAPAQWLAAVASYFPLSTIAAAETLRGAGLPAALKALLVQQVDEPAIEQRDRRDLPTLTPVTAGISREVQQQYEQNPYPRWIMLRQPDPPCSADAYVRRQLPSAGFQPLAPTSPLDVLIAGCGTGQEAIETAQQLENARVLALDLSRASLAYARRKTAELGIGNVDYAQADLVNIGMLGRTFDVVSSVGVLHHLSDPAAGLAALSACLRPGGLMRLGLYSEQARRHVVAAREFIARGGYGSGGDDIRRCRQDLIAAGGEVAQVAGFRDFYSTSECRDLLFHVQEHRFTIAKIAELLGSSGLRFLGFVVDATVRSAYLRRFPQDAAMSDLGAWRDFESAHPDTFLGMYVFWVQKMAAA